MFVQAWRAGGCVTKPVTRLQIHIPAMVSSPEQRSRQALWSAFALRRLGEGQAGASPRPVHPQPQAVARRLQVVTQDEQPAGRAQDHSGTDAAAAHVAVGHAAAVSPRPASPRLHVVAAPSNKAPVPAAPIATRTRSALRRNGTDAAAQPQQSSANDAVTSDARPVCNVSRFLRRNTAAAQYFSAKCVRSVWVACRRQRVAHCPFGTLL